MPTPDEAHEFGERLNRYNEAQAEEKATAAPPQCQYPGCTKPACPYWLVPAVGYNYGENDRRSRKVLERVLIAPWSVCEEHFEQQQETIRVTSLEALRQTERRLGNGPTGIAAA